MVSSLDIAWTAGFLEGEASFSLSGSSATIAVGQVQRDPIDRLIHLYGGSMYIRPPRGIARQPLHMWELAGIKGVGLMMTVFPLMSSSRRQKIKRVLSVWRAAPPQTKYRRACSKGHPFDADNTIRERLPSGLFRRVCRACRNGWALVNSGRRYKPRAAK